MRTILYSILATAMLAAGVLTQLVPPTFNETSPADGDKDGALRLHNYYRDQVGVPALTWCDNLTEVAQVAADWEAGADIPETPFNFTRRFPQNESYFLDVVYISPGTPRVFGAFYHATLAFWADHIHYHGEAIPNGDYSNYGAYSEYPLPMRHLPTKRVAFMGSLADNSPILKPRWSGTAPPASEWPAPRTARTEPLSLLPTLLRATCKYKISNRRQLPLVFRGFHRVEGCN